MVLFTIMPAKKSPAVVKLQQEYGAVLGRSLGGPKRNDPKWLRSKIDEAVPPPKLIQEVIS